MAKKPSGSTAKKNTGQQTTAKCTCQDPYKCDCGNRPPRPSKGHKWYPETQEWAGKGHKQRGASGQTATVAKQAITTDVGKTQVAQWQRLPTALLDEVCQKEGRAKPTYTNVADNDKNNITEQEFRYRVLVPYPRGQQRQQLSSETAVSDRDLVILPALPAENEEQAKQEAALLALLQLTPNLPHERKLPEPYKTTWLHAIANHNLQKKSDKGKHQLQQGQPSATSTSVIATGLPDVIGTEAASIISTVAKASTNLAMADRHVVSAADQKRKEQQERQRRNGAWHREEAIRMANRHHPVFLSPKLRRELETMLRNDGDELARKLLFQESTDDDDDDDDQAENSELQFYVRDRLLQQGFTSAQARAAFVAVAQPNHILAASQTDSNDNSSTTNALYESIFDECLQWLCIHLDEDQLPEQFDPRGRTLDVLSPTKPTTETTTKGTTTAVASPRTLAGSSSVAEFDNRRDLETESVTFAEQYGIDILDAKLILERLTEKQNERRQHFEDALWEALCKASSFVDKQGTNESDGSFDQAFVPCEDGTQHDKILEDELEAITAIFSNENECQVENYRDDKLVLQIRHSSFQEGSSTEIFIIRIVLSSSRSTSQNGQFASYPWVPPDRVLTFREGSHTSNSNPSKWCKHGASFHVRLIQFMHSLPLGEPMLFEIYGYIQQLMQEAEIGSFGHISLRPYLAETATTSNHIISDDTENAAAKANATTDETFRNSEKKLASFPAKREGLTTPKEPPHYPRRPRDKSAFWSTPPLETPPAIAFPTVGQGMQNQRNSLPAAKARREFIEMMKAADKSGRVVLVTGDTGCGKTTQIPAFILEENPLDSKIVVAQPRRLAATGVASRVASERGEHRVGIGSVGYVVRGDTAICKSTRLLFCTTGVLLRQLQCDKALEFVTHIVVDEVHERHLDTDVLLGILKGCLESYPHLRVVLMSATLDADRFAAYWGNNTPRLHIPGRTFPVSDYTLEDVLALTGYIPRKHGDKKRNYRNNRSLRKLTSRTDSEKSDEEESPTSKDGLDKDAASSKEQRNHGIPIADLVSRMDEERIDFYLLAQLVKCLLERSRAGEIGSILVFLPGVAEINRAMDIVRQETGNLSVQLLPLHGGLQPQEQSQVFRPAQKGVSRVILATNVAETSITIPDCTIVVDSCREKQSSYDPINRMPLLLERFASRASLKQRRGRAGRVKEGSCFKLLSKSAIEKLPEHSEPEIRRCALDQTLLSLLFLGIENGSGNFLQTLLDPPSTESVAAATSSLQKIGAVSELDDNSQRRLTPLGMHLAAIPAPPSVGKMLIMGCILGCRSAALAMAASMSLGRSPFLRIGPPVKMTGDVVEPTIDETKQNLVLEERATLFKSVGNSDHALIAAVYLQWDIIGAGSAERKRFCDRMGLSATGMRDMKQLAEQLSCSLDSVGFVASDDADSNLKSWRVVRTAAVAAMAPSQIVRVQRPGAKYAETAEGAMEKDGVAKELKFFIRSDSTVDQVGAFKENSKLYHGVNEERVFLHPASFNFPVGSFSCPWLVYHELVRTSKPFVRDSTECSTYALLLFGGKLRVLAEKHLIVIDDWVHLSAIGRIGALIGGLRRKVDNLLLQKIENPLFDIAQTIEMKLIVKLLSRDGSY